MQKTPQRVAEPEALDGSAGTPRPLRRCLLRSDVQKAPVNVPWVTVRKLNINFGSDSCPPATSSPGALAGPVTCGLHGGAPGRADPFTGSGRDRGSGARPPPAPRAPPRGPGPPGHPPANAAAPPPPPPAQRGPSGPARSPRGPREWVAGGRGRGAGAWCPSGARGVAGRWVSIQGHVPETYLRSALPLPQGALLSLGQHRADTPAAAATNARGELSTGGRTPPPRARPCARSMRTRRHPGPGRAATPAINRSRQPRPSAPRSPRPLALAPPPRSPAAPPQPEFLGRTCGAVFPRGFAGARDPARAGAGLEHLPKAGAGAAPGLAAGPGGCR